MQDVDAGTAIVPGADGGAAGGVLRYGALARRARIRIGIGGGFGSGDGRVSADHSCHGDTDGVADDGSDEQSDGVADCVAYRLADDKPHVCTDAAMCSRQLPCDITCIRNNLHQLYGGAVCRVDRNDWVLELRSRHLFIERRCKRVYSLQRRQCH